MRVNALWIVLSAIGPVAGAIVAKSSESAVATGRHLQDVVPPQTLNYRANYSASFQHLSDPLCVGDPPVLVVTCLGTNITILNTSDDSIICNQTNTPLLNGVSYECKSTCTTDCEDVYRYTTFDFDPINGPFGSIFFMCEGDTLKEIDAEFVYRGGTNNGTCAASSDASDAGRNYHMGRMGISCPVESGSTREYVYDDTYFDCVTIDVLTQDISLSTDSEDVFACYVGFRCKGAECSNRFVDFRIDAYVPKFFDTCVESLVEITTFPTMAPATSSYKFTARFEASWGTFYEPLELQSLCSIGENVPVTITCENGADIKYVNSTDSVPVCANSRSNELTCFTNQDKIVNQFYSVIYVSAYDTENSYEFSFTLSFSETINESHNRNYKIPFVRYVKDLMFQ